jgi:hypothetical protein
VQAHVHAQYSVLCRAVLVVKTSLNNKGQLQAIYYSRQRTRAIGSRSVCRSFDRSVSAAIKDDNTSVPTATLKSGRGNDRDCGNSSCSGYWGGSSHRRVLASSNIPLSLSPRSTLLTPFTASSALSHIFESIRSSLHKISLSAPK